MDRISEIQEIHKKELQERDQDKIKLVEEFNSLQAKYDDLTKNMRLERFEHEQVRVNNMLNEYYFSIILNLIILGNYEFRKSN